MNQTNERIKWVQPQDNIQRVQTSKAFNILYIICTHIYDVITPIHQWRNCALGYFIPFLKISLKSISNILCNPFNKLNKNIISFVMQVIEALNVSYILLSYLFCLFHVIMAATNILCPMCVVLTFCKGKNNEI